MTRRARPSRRALTLLELVIALTITAMVAAAITGMMGAVASGVDTRQDGRSAMTRAQASQTRLGAYIAPSRAFLDIAPEQIVLWLDDGRESGTVHASEIRWLLHDESARTISVHYVKFPDEWLQIARELADNEYPSSADWTAVLSFYEGQGWTGSYTLIDDVELAAASGDSADCTLSTVARLDLNFNPDDDEPLPLHLACALRRHVPPVN